MKTCLVSLCYLDGEDKSGSSRLERNIKYLNYYWPLRDELGFKNMVLLDNDSDARNVARLVNRADTWTGNLFPEFPTKVDAPIRMFRFHEHLSFGSTFSKDDPRHSVDYPYSWRGLEFLGRIFNELDYEKIIVADSDTFVLSEKLAHTLRAIDKGWFAPWCPKYGFPEASLQVICRDYYNEYFGKMFPPPWQRHVGKVMEKVLPYSYISKEFKGDRYGEGFLPVTDDMDFYSQAPVGIAMKYRGNTL